MAVRRTGPTGAVLRGVPSMLAGRTSHGALRHIQFFWHAFFVFFLCRPYELTVLPKLVAGRLCVAHYRVGGRTSTAAVHSSIAARDTRPTGSRPPRASCPS